MNPTPIEDAAKQAPEPSRRPELLAAPGLGPAFAAGRTWAAAYRVELLLFLSAFVVLACFSSQRFLRQSAAPHFVYQAKAWLEGRLDIDPQVLPNVEDWACVRELDGVKARCSGRPLATDRWYVSFPAFPAVVMAPFVALHGYQFNDTSFTVFVAALAVAFFYSLLRFLSRANETIRSPRENLVLALTLGFGSVFFYCAIRGEVWFSAEVMGVLFTTLYVRNAVRVRHPVLAGLFFSMATLTRTPLAFSIVFFLLEAVCPEHPNRLGQLRTLATRWRSVMVPVVKFAAGAAPLAIAAAAYNAVRFGKLGEFGHAFLFDNRVNADVDRYGLFSVEYLARNVSAAFLKLPAIQLNPLRLSYDPWGMSLFLTLPFLLLLLVRPPASQSSAAPGRLTLPLWVTVAVTALPGLFYQNTGYMQFGFRFSLDYTPYLVLLLATSGWSLRSRWVQAALALGLLVNFWGAVAFHGYTEYVRHW